jgi:mannose-6-phosphate isomerase-like protein (cupin superfamily)
MVDIEREDHDERPWGSYEILKREPGMWVKRIEVKPNARFSLQKHMQRSEHWVVVRGEGIVTRGLRKIAVTAGDSIDIPLGKKHRMTNKTALPLVFIEIAFGDQLSEDDIVRFEDDYGRT